jgi:hypothetical protein
MSFYAASSLQLGKIDFSIYTIHSFHITRWVISFCCFHSSDNIAELDLSTAQYRATVWTLTSIQLAVAITLFCGMIYASFETVRDLLTFFYHHRFIQCSLFDDEIIIDLNFESDLRANTPTVDLLSYFCCQPTIGSFHSFAWWLHLYCYAQMRMFTWWALLT